MQSSISEANIEQIKVEKIKLFTNLDLKRLEKKDTT
jgi:hypothetical protein